MKSLVNVKLVATDMDGTLLNPNHQVSSIFYNLFEKLKEHNILFVAASGRPFYGITSKLDKIKDDIIIVPENGGLVIKNNEILLSNELKKESISLINNSLQKLPEVNAVYCTKDRAYTDSNSPELLNLLSEYYSNYKRIESIYDIEAPIYKIAIFHKESSERYIYPHVKHLEENFKVKVSANHWVDISENNANKGHAIQLIQKLHNISPEETLVFGDYNNDIEMLQAAHFSYAMENAHPLVKQVANFETKSNKELGVEIILEKMINEKEKHYSINESL